MTESPTDSLSSLNEGTFGTNIVEVTEESRAAAEAAKAEANSFFKSRKYHDAEALYSKAIKLNPSEPVYWSNRAFANYKMELYGYAIRDADEALRLDPTFIKGYYRRATANMALSKFKASLRDLRTVCRYAPNDPDAKAKLAEVEKTVRRIEFENALSYDVDQKSIVESLHIDEIVVDDDYDGMRWEDGSALAHDWVQDMIARFKDMKTVHRKYAYKIMKIVKEHFEAQESVVDVRVPLGADGRMTICGDVHGQFYDLISLFETQGYPSETRGYLFNGDFVDRGSFSTEVILTLFAFKALYPSSFFMARGNHESLDMNRVYGFEGEVKAKYTESTFKFFTEVFNSLPLGNVIENRIFVVHGGLFSRDKVSIDELKKIDRFKQPSGQGLMCEMLWADPCDTPGVSPSKRGVGLQFGPDVTKEFLEYNNLDLLVRSHEVRDEGYQIEHDGKCVTVFSAPNYCDSVGNKGACIHVSRKDRVGEQDRGDQRPALDYDYIQFEAVPHPAVKAMRYAPQFGGLM